MTCSRIILGSKSPQFCQSMLDTVETGFGDENILVKDPPTKPVFKTHLLKENYLSEFKNDVEKEIVRNHLQVYSKKEIDERISHIIVDPITKDEIKEIVKEYDFIQAVSVEQSNFKKLF